MKHSYINHHNVISQKTSYLIGTGAEPQTSDLSLDYTILLFKKSIAVTYLLTYLHHGAESF